MNPTTAVLVNETFVRRFFAHERAVGRDFGRTEDRNRLQPQHIVGVVGDAKYRDLREPAPPTVYVPLEGFGAFGGLTLQIRSPFPVAGLLSQLRTELSLVHPALEIGDVSDQKVLVDNAMLRERLLALLAGFFALVTLVLAVIGLYGVMSYSVVQRTREIGIRVAPGAQVISVLRSVLTDVLVVTALGLLIGLGGGMLLARFVRTLLYEVTQYDVASVVLPTRCFLRPRWRPLSSRLVAPPTWIRSKLSGRVGAHANAAGRGQGRLRRGRSPASTTLFEAPYGNNRRFCRGDNSL